MIRKNRKSFFVFMELLFHSSFLLCLHLVQGSGVRWRLRRLFLLGDARKWYFSHQSPVIPLISGEWIVSHVWYEILRLSPHLFWLGLFTHRAFSSAQDDDTRGLMFSQAGGIAAFLEDGIPVSQPSPLGEGAPQGRIGQTWYERQWG